jgi:vacuolar-type H+-ATPase subunit E/Vma4
MRKGEKRQLKSALHDVETKENAEKRKQEAKIAKQQKSNAEKEADKQAAAAKRQANVNKKRKRLDECNDIIESARKKAHGMV